MAQPVEVLHPHAGPPVVVHGDVALRHLPQVLPHEHRGEPGEVGPQLLIALRPGGNQDDPVHLPPDHQLEELLLLLQVPGGVAQNDVVPPGPGLAVDMVGQVGHERVVYPREDQAQQLGALHHHGPGHGVGGVVHLLAHLEDALPGVHTDLRTAGEGPGDGGVGNPGGFCDIFDGHVLHMMTSVTKIFRIIFRKFIVKPAARNCKGKLSYFPYFLYFCTD